MQSVPKVLQMGWDENIHSKTSPTGPTEGTPQTWVSNSSSNLLRDTLVRSHCIFDGFMNKSRTSYCLIDISCTIFLMQETLETKSKKWWDKVWHHIFDSRFQPHQRCSFSIMESNSGPKWVVHEKSNLSATPKNKKMISNLFSAHFTAMLRRTKMYFQFSVNGFLATFY